MTEYESGFTRDEAIIAGVVRDAYGADVQEALWNAMDEVQGVLEARDLQPREFGLRAVAELALFACGVADWPTV